MPGKLWLDITVQSNEVAEVENGEILKQVKKKK
jgi:hypothetical protein